LIIHMLNLINYSYLFFSKTEPGVYLFDCMYVSEAICLHRVSGSC